MRKRRILEEINIDDIEFHGKGVARVNGKVIFVEKTLPGEVVDVRIIKEKKDHAFAKPIKFHKLSNIRMEAFCSHFDLCGGCTWQTVPYEKQLEFKSDLVKSAFEHIGKFEAPPVRPIIPCEENVYYRNKLEFTFSNTRWLTREEVQGENKIEARQGLGFHLPGHFDKVLDIEKCYLQKEPSNSIRLEIKKFAMDNNMEFFDIRKHKGFLRNVIIRNTSKGEVLLLMSFYKNDEEAINLIMEHLAKKFPEISSLHYVINSSKNDALTSQEVIHYGGDKAITEKIDGLEYRIGPKSFFQTNSQQAGRLYDVILKSGSLKGEELVLDLYSGIGTIALYLARHCKEVIGVEQVPEAVIDAKHNAQINKIDNCKFYDGDVGEYLIEYTSEQRKKPDIIIVDPPRSGMHPKVVEGLLSVAPQRIVYVSCNPSTHARDVKMMEDIYRLKSLQPVDMFPHTYHIENVAVLELKEG